MNGSVTTRKRVIVSIAALAGIAAIAAFDYGIEVDFAAADLYLIPVALTAWFLGRDWITWAVLAAAMVAFAVLFEGADEATALSVVERFLVSPRTLEREHGWRATASVGLVTFRKHPDRIDDIVGAADEFMYEAKARGKDTVVAGTLNGRLVVMERSAPVVVPAQPV